MYAQDNTGNKRNQTNPYKHLLLEGKGDLLFSIATIPHKQINSKSVDVKQGHGPGWFQGINGHWLFLYPHPVCVGLVPGKRGEFWVFQFYGVIDSFYG